MLVLGWFKTALGGERNIPWELCRHQLIVQRVRFLGVGEAGILAPVVVPMWTCCAAPRSAGNCAVPARGKLRPEVWDTWRAAHL
jgi:hypothetical protein